MKEEPDSILLQHLFLSVPRLVYQFPPLFPNLPLCLDVLAHGRIFQLNAKLPVEHLTRRLRPKVP